MTTRTRSGAAGFVASLLVCVVLLLASSVPLLAAEPDRGPVVLVLVDGLSWEEVEKTPALEEIFEDGASANLSTAQGATPEDSGMGYVLLGAGSRADTSVLPERLPRDRTEIPEAFGGPASTVQPGLFGEALERREIEAAAIGERAGLVIMNRSGHVPGFHAEDADAESLEKALEGGVDFVSAEAGGPRDAGRLAQAALGAEATVAVASPNAPPGSEDLTPFAISGEKGLLYSPTTRASGLMTNADVAPALLDRLSAQPNPTMQGRATSVHPGAAEQARRLGERISFVSTGRGAVWIVVGIASLVLLVANVFRKGRRGFHTALLALASLPAGALLAAAIPLSNVPFLAAAILLLACALTAVALKTSSAWTGALAAVCLGTAVLVAADAALGGALMRFSTLGYNPAYGARFYGLGNEYAAVLAGALVTGLGALAYEIRLSTWVVAAVGIICVLAAGLPTMGADVGGSLSLGIGTGALIGLRRGAGVRGVVLWTMAGLALAAGLFLASGLLFPDASHGSRAASGQLALWEIAGRKLLLSLSFLKNPLLLAALAAALTVTYAGWRRARGTELGASILAGAISAAASGALNDSGILATLFALIHPTTAALLTMTSTTVHTRSNAYR